MKVVTHSICFVGYDLPVLELFKKLVCHAWEQKGEDLSWVACHLSSRILTSTLASSSQWAFDAKHWCLNSFLSLLSSSRSHLHNAVVHNSAYKIFFICCGALEIMLIADLVLYSSSILFFTLLYPLFMYCHCSSSTSYVKRISHTAV